MKRAIVVLALLAAFIVCLAATALAQVYPPTSLPRVGGDCVWANGKVYWFTGRSASVGPDAENKTYSCDVGNAGISIYTPNAGAGSWVSSAWNDPTSPAGMDLDLNGKCDWQSDTSKLGIWAQTNLGVAYDDDNDTVKEIFDVVGYNQNQSQIWRYDPNAPDTNGRGKWSLKASGGSTWASFRRGAVALNGSKIYMASGGGTPAGQFGWYDFATDTWTLGPDGPDSQQSSGAVVNNKFYVVGGIANNGLDIYECDLTQNPPVWSNGGASVATLNVGVTVASVVAYNGNIYIVGGRMTDGNATNAIQKFDPTTGTVTTVGTMPAARFAGGAAVDTATGMLYYGGGGSTGDPYRPTDAYTNWWKTDLNNATLTITAIADDPASFPYEDWETGPQVTLTGKVVDPAGNPVPGAFVGVKKSPMAAADAKYTGTTDTNGNYSFGLLPGSYYISAWKPGWAPTADQTINIPTNDYQYSNLQLTALAGKVIPIAIENVAANDFDIGRWPEEMAPQSAVDGVISAESRWSTHWNPHTDNPDTGFIGLPVVYFYVKFDQPTDFNGMTIYRYLEMNNYGNSADDYSIDFMTGSGDPLTAATWDSPSANASRVYSAANTIHGFAFDNSIAADALSIEGRGITGVRLGFTNCHWPPAYMINELQFHSATEFDSLAYGWVKDTQGNGIYNAVVELGGRDGTAVTTDENGYWSIPATPGDYEFFVDASGYGSTLTRVTVPGGGVPLVRTITLNAKNEPKIANGDFELAGGGDEAVADGWTFFITPPQAPESFIGGRTSDYNSTPGGNNSGFVKVGTAPTDPVQGDAYFLDAYLKSTPIPVDPANKYNFYFKMRSADGSDSPMPQWDLVWLRTDGTVITDYTVDYWSQDLSSPSWAQVVRGGFQNDGMNKHNMIRMVPPADAAYAQAILGVPAWPVDASRNGTILFDDVVFDQVERSYITGKVTDAAGNPVAGAIVGVKATTNAAADAASYAIADANGDYKAAIEPTNWYVAAWKPGYNVSADVQADATAGPATADLQLTQKSKKNISADGTITATMGSDTAAQATDGDNWTNWDSTEATAGADLVIDFGTTKTLTGTVIFWTGDRAKDYSVDYTTDGTNWTTVYSVTSSAGGFDTGYSHYVDPIRFDSAIDATQIRVHSTTRNPNSANYGIYEWQVSGTANSLYADKIGDVKKMAVGTDVQLYKPVTVSSTTDGSSYGPAGMTFWLEDLDRSNGIRVTIAKDANGDPLTTNMGWAGEVADITGKVAKDATTGEVYVEASNVQTWQWWGKEFQPVGMNNKALVASTMPCGLYVKTWGTVKAGSLNTTDSTFVITDGSGTDITVYRGAAGRATLPVEGTWVAVKGVLGGGGKIYEWPTDGYIRGWLMNGAYSVANPNTDELGWQTANLNQNFFTTADAAINPKIGDNAPNGGKWFVAGAGALDTVVDLSKITFTPVTGQTCIYASIWVKPAVDLTTDNSQLMVGSDDGYKLIITNSALTEPFVLTNSSTSTDPTAITMDDNFQSPVLKAGEWNHIIMKVNNLSGAYNFSVRALVMDDVLGDYVPVVFETSPEKPVN